MKDQRSETKRLRSLKWFWLFVTKTENPGTFLSFPLPLASRGTPLSLCHYPLAAGYLESWEKIQDLAVGEMSRGSSNYK